ncbi:F23M19.3 [Arabidopsis thaliana]|nr:F23M19.3 [Arabidopsis thaliana]
MGGLCSRSSSVNNAPGGTFAHVNGHHLNNNASDLNSHSGESGLKDDPSPVTENVDDNKHTSESFSFPIVSSGSHPQNIEDGIPRLSRVLSQKSRSTKSRQAAVAKVSEVSSLLGRAGTMGLGKAVDVLDTLGSSMTNLNLSGGFSSATTVKGNKISILSFEVANTIVKGANLMHSLSKDSITHLKEVVLPSEGVQNLISKDMDELLRIAAADKRFQHDPVTLVVTQRDLYHELHALDRFEQDYQRKIQEEENPSTAQRGVGDTLAILRTELKSQKKHVRNLKKKSLWSRILEEVMEKLVDVVHFLHLEIHEAFGGADPDKPANDPPINHKKLGSAGLALHYANIITQIDTLVSRSSTMPASTRDALYQGLPPSIKSALRSRIQSFQVKEELTVPQIKAEMEKTLQWLVPVATNTTKAHHGFGWVGEWASSGSEANQRPAGQTILRIDTLHHADKEKTEAYILDLVVWLHHLVTQVRATTGYGLRSPVKSPIRSPNQKTIQLSSGSHNPSMGLPLLTTEDQEMLRDVSKRRKTPGISKSQEFETVAKARLCKHHRLSKSSSHSPMMGEMMKNKKDTFSTRRPSSVPIIDFDIDRMKALDVIDRVDTIRSL